MGEDNNDQLLTIATINLEIVMVVYPGTFWMSQHVATGGSVLAIKTTKASFT